jgi:hypothetical protein
MLDILPHLERFEGKGRIQRVVRKAATDSAKEEHLAAEPVDSDAAPELAPRPDGPGGSGLVAVPQSSK